MSEIALAKINSFAHDAKQTVPTEEPIFVLTGSQLQEIISRAIQPLQDAISDLKATVVSLESEVSATKATELQDFKSLSRENRDLFEWVGDIDEKIGHKEPGKTELSRAEKIEKYLQARPDHRATFETLKGHLGIDRILLNQALKALMKAHPGEYTIIKTPGDKRKHTIVMHPKLGQK